MSGYPACPALLVAWSHLSSALLIVYLPNEGGGTLRHVIDSHVLLPSHCPALGFLAEMFSEGEGGWYFTYLCVFLVILFPPSLLLEHQRGLWEIKQMHMPHNGHFLP